MSDTAQSAPQDTEPKPKLKPAFWAIILIMGIVLGFVLRTWVVGIYSIPSGSMEPTLHGSENHGDQILVNKAAYEFSSPSNGDIIVFNAERWADDDSTYIKRVIAGPGQTVGVNSKGEVTVDGRALTEPYLSDDESRFEPGVLDCDTSPQSQKCFPDVTLGKDEYWVMGDNRAHSADSTYGCRGKQDPDECRGPVTADEIQGRYMFTLPWF